MAQTNTCTRTHSAFELCCYIADALACIPMQHSLSILILNFKSFEKKMLHRWMSTKKYWAPQLPLQISNGSTLLHYYILWANFVYLCYLHLQKLLLLSYFSSHFSTLFFLSLKPSSTFILLFYTRMPVIARKPE